MDTIVVTAEQVLDRLSDKGRNARPGCMVAMKNKGVWRIGRLDYSAGQMPSLGLRGANGEGAFHHLSNADKVLILD